MLHKLTRVKPRTPTSYLMMPYQSMALTIRGVAHLLRDLSELISAATSHILGSTRAGH